MGVLAQNISLIGHPECFGNCVVNEGKSEELFESTGYKKKTIKELSYPRYQQLYFT
jgi:hypothetical protein